MRVFSRRVPTVVCAVVSVVVLAGLVEPVAAAPDAKAPAAIRALKVGAVGQSDFVVRFAASKRARRYRVWTATHPSLLVAGGTGVRRTRASTRRRVRVAVPVTGSPWYVRVEAVGKGGTRRLSAIRAVHLQPATPTGPYVRSTKLGLSVNWNGPVAERFLVQQATDPAMRTGVRTWRTLSPARTFTPTDLKVGRRYWFRVRAQNGSRSTGWTTPVSAVAQSYGLTVRVMSWNVLRRVKDGRRYASGETVQPWNTVRGPAVADQIRRSGAQVVVLQEAGDDTGVRAGSDPVSMAQHEWLARRLGPSWTSLAGRTSPWGVGNHLLVDTRTVTSQAAHQVQLYGDGVGADSYMNVALIKDRRTGVVFTILGTHLHPGLSARDDRRRRVEAEAMVRWVRSATQSGSTYGGTPRVYVGDMNSDRGPRYPLDSAGRVFDAARLADADASATALSATVGFDSFNRLSRTPAATGTHIDQIRTEPGVGVRSWQLLAPIRSGRTQGVLASDHFPVVADLVIPWTPGGTNAVPPSS